MIIKILSKAFTYAIISRPGRALSVFIYTLLIYGNCLKKKQKHFHLDSQSTLKG